MTWLTSILNFVSAPITEVVKGYQIRETLKVEQLDKALGREHELNLKKIDVNMELAKQGMQIEANWDTNAQNQMTTSWKDEWFVMLFSIPLILAFFPSTQKYVLEGFSTLEKTPDWYMWLVVGIVSATFGLRWLFGKIKLGK